MERTQVLEMMGELKLYGMKAAYDETLAVALKRQHEPQRFVGDLLHAEISEKHARSIKYQLTIAKLPLAKDIDDFVFKGTPINEALVRGLADGVFLAEQRNALLFHLVSRLYERTSVKATSIPKALRSILLLVLTRLVLLISIPSLFRRIGRRLSMSRLKILRCRLWDCGC
jgi:hypothetical protein